MSAYLEQITVSHRPTSVGAASLALRHLAAHLTATDPDCVDAWPMISRSHIEGYKLALAARPGRKGTISNHDHPPQPGHGPHLLRADHRLGLATTRPDGCRSSPGTSPKPTSRCPEVPGRPHRGEVHGHPGRRSRPAPPAAGRTVGPHRDESRGAGRRSATTPCTGSATRWWLRIPIGKLHNDRNVPLHPLLVGLITDYQAWRGPSRNGFLLEREDGQPFDRRTIHRYVERVARRAGIGQVHPHQLRHTLATQCLNRGMSLEAIAALLGHRSPRMTLVYARISDTTWPSSTSRPPKPSKPTPQPQRRHRQRPAGHASPAARQRALHPAARVGLPLPDHLRGMRVLRDRRRVHRHPAPPARRRHRHADAARAKLYDELVAVIDANPA